MNKIHVSRRSCNCPTDNLCRACQAFEEMALAILRMPQLRYEDDDDGYVPIIEDQLSPAVYVPAPGSST